MRSANSDQTAPMRSLIRVRWSHKTYCRFCRALSPIDFFFFLKFQNKFLSIIPKQGRPIGLLVSTSVIMQRKYVNICFVYMYRDVLIWELNMQVCISLVLRIFISHEVEPDRSAWMRWQSSVYFVCSYMWSDIILLIAVSCLGSFWTSLILWLQYVFG